MLWNRLLVEAQERRTLGKPRIPLILASDHDPKAVRAALANAQRAGVADQIRVERRAFSALQPPLGIPGLLIANPPLWRTISATEDLAEFYTEFGEVLKTRLNGWRAALFTSNPELGKRMGLRAEKVHVFHNGPLDCRLLRFRVEPEFFVDRATADQRTCTRALKQAAAGGAEGFINRLNKNLRHLQRADGQHGTG